MHTGEGPPRADATSPGGLAVAAAEVVASERLPLVADLPGSGRPGKKRSRRRRRRRPVYALDAARPTNAVAAQHRPAVIARAAEPPVHPGLPIVVPRLEVHPPPVRPAMLTDADRRPQGPLYAALDLGTNNCRLLIAAPRERGFRVVDAFSRIVRLGEGMGRTGRLGEAAMARAIEALKACRAKLQERGVARARLIATEACRGAVNGPDFIARVRTETGLALDIVSQEVEARLAVAGCASLIDAGASGVVLFDIGGGSTELVWIDLAATSGRRRRMADRIRSWTSLPVGVVTLSERHGGEHVSPASFEAMVDEVAAMVEGFADRGLLDAAVAAGGVHMLGTSGTVTTLAGVHLGLERYDRRRVDGLWMTGRQVAEMTDKLCAMDYAGRVANPCIGRERADLVLAGCAILEAFRRRWPVERLRVADRGLREGMLVELMSEDGVWRQSPRPASRAEAPPAASVGRG